MQTCKTCGKSYDSTAQHANQNVPDWACKVCGSEVIRAKTIKISDDTVEESGVIKQVNHNTTESQGV
jgi:DNA-directed RNA polymerase subunit RPC12/RpoP